MRRYSPSTVHYSGVYNSYWINKLSNIFIKKGKKTKVMKYINLSLIQIKFLYNINPIIFLFEVIESIKPIFKLENTFPGKTAVVYPRAVNLDKRYNVAIKWIKLYILDNQHNLRRSRAVFWKQFYIEITQLSLHKSNPLIKKRDEYHQNAIHLQDNLRYTWLIK